MLHLGELLVMKEKIPSIQKSYSDVVQRRMKSTCRMGISWIRNPQSILQNKGGGNHIDFTQCHASTSDNNQDTKYQFYGKPQSIVEKRLRKGLTILMRGPSFKVGTDNIGCRDVLRQYGLVERKNRRDLCK